MGKFRVLMCVLVLTGVVVGLVSGCGGSGDKQGPAVSTAGKIEEYVGNGYAGERPLPPGLTVPQVQTQAQSTHLKIGAPPKETVVSASNINWFRIPAISVNKNLIVTLQPTADEDSDLFVLEGEAGVDYIDGVTTYGSSRRIPTTSPDDSIPSGYAPDWVAFNVGPVEFATSYVAVHGYPNPQTTKHFRIEADSVWALQVNGAIKAEFLPPDDSHWYRFNCTSGTAYTVTIEQVLGDPDVYVYNGASTGYVGKNTVAGGGSVGFTATSTGPHYVRVYGWFHPTTEYTAKVTSP